MFSGPNTVNFIVEIKDVNDDPATIETGTETTYTVTYTATDHSGNSTSVNRTVQVADFTAPLVTLLSENSNTYEVAQGASTYVEHGARATDAGQEVDFFSNTTSGGMNLVITGTVDTTTIGTYTVTYTATDANNNSGIVNRTVSVVDNTAPVITIIGDNPATVTENDNYTDLGITVVDNSGETVGAGLTVTTSNPVDTSNVDNSPYTITYVVEDSSGNQATATRTVNVESAVAGELSGSSTLTLERYASFVDPGANLVQTITTTTVNLDTSDVVDQWPAAVDPSIPNHSWAGPYTSSGTGQGQTLTTSSGNLPSGNEPYSFEFTLQTDGGWGSTMPFWWGVGTYRAMTLFGTSSNSQIGVDHYNCQYLFGLDFDSFPYDYTGAVTIRATKSENLGDGGVTIMIYHSFDGGTTWHQPKVVYQNPTPNVGPTSMAATNQLHILASPWSPEGNLNYDSAGNTTISNIKVWHSVQAVPVYFDLGTAVAAGGTVYLDLSSEGLTAVGGSLTFNAGPPATVTNPLGVYATLNTAPSIQARPGQGFTIEMKVRINTWRNYNYFFEFREPGPSEHGANTIRCGPWAGPGGTQVFVVGGSSKYASDGSVVGEQWFNAETVNTWTTGVWYVVKVEHTGSEVRLYVDGVRQTFNSNYEGGGNDYFSAVKSGAMYAAGPAQRGSNVIFTDAEGLYTNGSKTFEYFKVAPYAEAPLDASDAWPGTYALTSSNIPRSGTITHATGGLSPPSSVDPVWSSGATEYTAGAQVTMPAGVYLPHGTDPYTIEFSYQTSGGWLNTEILTWGVSQTKKLVWVGNYHATEHGLRHFTWDDSETQGPFDTAFGTGAGQVGFAHTDTGAQLIRITKEAASSSGDGCEMRIYVNGVLRKTSTGHQGPYEMQEQHATTLNLLHYGSGAWGQTPSGDPNGTVKLKDIKIWRAVVPPAILTVQNSPGSWATLDWAPVRMPFTIEFDVNVATFQAFNHFFEFRDDDHTKNTIFCGPTSNNTIAIGGSSTYNAGGDDMAPPVLWSGGPYTSTPSTQPIPLSDLPYGNTAFSVEFTYQTDSGWTGARGDGTALISWGPNNNGTAGGSFHILTYHEHSSMGGAAMYVMSNTSWGSLSSTWQWARFADSDATTGPSLGFNQTDTAPHTIKITHSGGSSGTLTWYVDGSVVATHTNFNAVSNIQSSDARTLRLLDYNTSSGGLPGNGNHTLSNLRIWASTDDPTQQFLAVTNTALSTNQDYAIKLTHDGEQVCVYVDDVKQEFSAGAAAPIFVGGNDYMSAVKSGTMFCGGPAHRSINIILGSSNSFYNTLGSQTIKSFRVTNSVSSNAVLTHSSDGMTNDVGIMATLKTPLVIKAPFALSTRVKFHNLQPLQHIFQFTNAPPFASTTFTGGPYIANPVDVHASAVGTLPYGNDAFSVEFTYQTDSTWTASSHDNGTEFVSWGQPLSDPGNTAVSVTIIAWWNTSGTHELQYVTSTTYSGVHFAAVQFGTGAGQLGFSETDTAAHTIRVTHTGGSSGTLKWYVDGVLRATHESKTGPVNMSSSDAGTLRVLNSPNQWGSIDGYYGGKGAFNLSNVNIFPGTTNAALSAPNTLSLGLTADNRFVFEGNTDGIFHSAITQTTAVANQWYDLRVEHSGASGAVPTFLINDVAQSYYSLSPSADWSGLTGVFPAGGALPASATRVYHSIAGNATDFETSWNYGTMTVGHVTVADGLDLPVVATIRSNSDNSVKSEAMMRQTPGTYTITYTAGVLSATRTVTVVDSSAPVFTDGDISTLTIERGHNYVETAPPVTDPGASGMGVPEPTATLVVDTSVAVDTSVVGDYARVFQATDGVYTVSHTRTVRVRDTVSPVITLLEPNAPDVYLAGPYTTPTSLGSYSGADGPLNAASGNAYTMPYGTEACDRVHLPINHW